MSEDNTVGWATLSISFDALRADWLLLVTFELSLTASQAKVVEMSAADLYITASACCYSPTSA